MIKSRMIEPAELADRARALGLRDEDVSDLVAASRRLSGPDREQVASSAARLAARVGAFGSPPGEDPVWPAGSAGGVTAVLALIDSAAAVADYHAGRGVPADVSAATLADLGQQVSVHRQVFGAFGLDTHHWLAVVWSGALYALGRLQFELWPDPDQPGRWVLSTHIPQRGPLQPGAVDAAFDQARSFFPKHFPEFAISAFFCRSWLLDPELAAALSGSNLAAFSRRWQLTGRTQPGEADTLFFVFARRGRLPVADLPADTALRQVTRQRLGAGQSWTVYDGRLAW